MSTSPLTASEGAVRRWSHTVRTQLAHPLAPYYMLLGCTSLLLGIGLIEVLSASSVSSFRTFGNSYHWFLRQLTWVAIGIPSALVAARLPHKVLRRLAWPAIIKGLRDRENSIADSLATAQKVKEEMALMKSENEALLAKAREERAQLLKEARETKDRIISEAKEQAKVEAGKVVAEAQAAINAQKMAALTEVKNQVGKLVIEVSEKVLRKELANKEAQEAHIKGLVDGVKLN